MGHAVTTTAAASSTAVTTSTIATSVTAVGVAVRTAAIRVTAPIASVSSFSAVVLFTTPSGGSEEASSHESFSKNRCLLLVACESGKCGTKAKTPPDALGTAVMFRYENGA